VPSPWRTGKHAPNQPDYFVPAEIRGNFTVDHSWYVDQGIQARRDHHPAAVERSGGRERRGQRADVWGSLDRPPDLPPIAEGVRRSEARPGKAARIKSIGGPWADRGQACVDNPLSAQIASTGPHGEQSRYSLVRTWSYRDRVLGISATSAESPNRLWPRGGRGPRGIFQANWLPKAVEYVRGERCERK
jgi:hypothetical protein